MTVTLTRVAASRGHELPSRAAKWTTEFIGTFVLVFTAACAVLSNQPLAPLAVGSALMIAVYAGGHVSGGHYNPAVSVAVLLRGRLDASDLVPYLVAQLAAAAAAAGVARYVINPTGQHPRTFTGHTIGAALVAEFVVTFILAYVVLNVATSKDASHNSFYGLAIGFTVFAGAVAVGGVSGGVFNPAVAVGGALAGFLSWANIWIYFLACTLAGVGAAGTFRYLNPTDT